jgi:uncharacterized membrane protein YfhO
MELRAAGPGVLVVAEGWDPGWSAEVDGAPAAVLRVNHVQMAVPLSGGAHRVVLRYRPRGFVAALAGSGIATAILLVWTLRGAAGGRRWRFDPPRDGMLRSPFRRSAG